MSEDINDARRRFLAAASMTIVVTQLGMIGSAKGQSHKTAPADLSTIKGQRITPAALQSTVEGELPSLSSTTTWLNSRPLTAAGLRGKVVLIDFWTYTCIN